MNYYIKGNKEKADQIKAAFEKLGIQTGGYDFSRKDVLYFTYEAKGETYMMSSLLDTGLDNIILTHPDYKELKLPVEPKFKDGDKVVFGTLNETIAVVLINEQRYICESCREILFDQQDKWHLAPKPHYDISYFKPFQKVLVRESNERKWVIDFYGFVDEGIFICTGCGYYSQCIPFDGNEHLLGTTDMCDEQYVNW